MIKKQLREHAMLKEKKIEVVYAESKIHDLVNSLTNNEFVEILNLISDRCIVQSEGIDRFFTLDLIDNSIIFSVFSTFVEIILIDE